MRHSIDSYASFRESLCSKADCKGCNARIEMWDFAFKHGLSMVTAGFWNKFDVRIFCKAGVGYYIPVPVQVEDRIVKHEDIDASQIVKPE